jgi:hypothetical protein
LDLLLFDVEALAQRELTSQGLVDDDHLFGLGLVRRNVRIGQHTLIVAAFPSIFHLR